MIPGADIINWLDGAVGRVSHGPLHRFTFLRDGDFTGLQVEHLLQQYGIRVWQREFDNPDELGLHVKQKQAIWAEYLLCRAGVSLTSQLLDPRNDTYRPNHPEGSMPEPWTAKGIGPHTFVDHLVDWLSRILP